MVAKTTTKTIAENNNEEKQPIYALIRNTGDIGIVLKQYDFKSNWRSSDSCSKVFLVRNQGKEVIYEDNNITIIDKFTNDIYRNRLLKHGLGDETIILNIKNEYAIVYKKNIKYCVVTNMTELFRIPLSVLKSAETNIDLLRDKISELLQVSDEALFNPCDIDTEIKAIQKNITELQDKDKINDKISELENRIEEKKLSYEEAILRKRRKNIEAETLRKQIENYDGLDFKPIPIKDDVLNLEEEDFLRKDLERLNRIVFEKNERISKAIKYYDSEKEEKIDAINSETNKTVQEIKRIADRIAILNNSK